MDNKNKYFETVHICYFVPKNVFFDSDNNLSNCIPGSGNDEK